MFYCKFFLVPERKYIPHRLIFGFAFAVQAFDEKLGFYAIAQRFLHFCARIRLSQDTITSLTGCGLTALGKLTNHRKRICFAESNSIRRIKEI